MDDAPRETVLQAALIEFAAHGLERLTGLPPARVQRWLGTGMLMIATTAMDLHGKKPNVGLAGQVCPSACSLTAPVMPQADVIPGGAAGPGGTNPNRNPMRSAALKAAWRASLPARRA